MIWIELLAFAICFAFLLNVTRDRNKWRKEADRQTTRTLLLSLQLDSAQARIKGMMAPITMNTKAAQRIVKEDK